MLDTCVSQALDIESWRQALSFLWRLSQPHCYAGCFAVLLSCLSNQLWAITLFLLGEQKGTLQKIKEKNWHCVCVCACVRTHMHENQIKY